MVRFWDTSALIPLTVVEPATAIVRPFLEEDEGIVVWWGTRVECTSALARRSRDHRVRAKDAHRVLVALAKEWSEVSPTEALRKRAERLLALHPIGAADALQLAAALVWARDEPAGNDFVCLDDRLRDAAGREGFRLLPGD